MPATEHDVSATSSFSKQLGVKDCAQVRLAALEAMGIVSPEQWLALSAEELAEALVELKTAGVTLGDRQSLRLLNERSRSDAPPKTSTVGIRRRRVEGFNPRAAEQRHDLVSVRSKTLGHTLEHISAIDRTYADYNGPVFKVLLVGDCGVGKKTYLCALAADDSNVATTMQPTSDGGYYFSYIFETDYGPVRYDVHTCGSVESLPPAPADEHGTVSKFNGAIMMFDATSDESYKRIPIWHFGINEKYDGHMPTVLCGSKVDAMHKEPSFCQKLFDISTPIVVVLAFANLLLQVIRAVLYGASEAMQSRVTCPLVLGAIAMLMIGKFINLFKLKKVDVEYHRKASIPYYEVSSERKFNVAKPFLYLTRLLTG